MSISMHDHKIFNKSQNLPYLTSIPTASIRIIGKVQANLLGCWMTQQTFVHTFMRSSSLYSITANVHFNDHAWARQNFQHSKLTTSQNPTSSLSITAHSTANLHGHAWMTQHEPKIFFKIQHYYEHSHQPLFYMPMSVSRVTSSQQIFNTSHTYYKHSGVAQLSIIH